MSRIASRESALIATYIHLIRDLDLDQILDDHEFVSSMGDFIQPMKLDEEMYAVAKNAFERKEIYARALNVYMKRWRFERLGYIEQAVLILACSELEFGLQNKAVIVNEAVRLVKLYGEEDSYRLVNGVLDAL